MKHPVHVLEWLADLVARVAFKLDRSANDDLAVTLHDPCNVARAGGLLEEPRKIIRAVAHDFREMPRGTIRERTYCCGAGGGLLTDEIMPVRLAGGYPRAMAVKAVQANFVATPCAICKAQLPEVMKHFGVPAEVGGVIDVFSRAMVLGRGTGA